jgi:uncharacterized protein (TIGR02599 family)
MKRSPHMPSNPSAGFTLLETMVASAVFVMMLVLVFSAVSGASAVTRRASEKISAYQSARTGFDLITETLAQATLNSYWDYVNSSGVFRAGGTAASAASFTPAAYARRSELHFLVGRAGSSPFPGTPGTGQAVCFQAPTGITTSTDYAGLNRLLNSYGFYVQYAPVAGLPSPFPSATPVYRYQLFQAVASAENFAVYGSTSGNAWVSTLTGSDALIAPIANNIVYLAIWPRKSPGEDLNGAALSSNYAYDSRAGTTFPNQAETQHQLPPVVQVTMVAIDEAGAQRLCISSSPPAEIANAFNGLFQNSRQKDFQDDIAELESRLSALNIGYRVFTAQIPLRESKMQ